MGEIRTVGPGKLADILFRYARKELSIQVKHADILIRCARNAYIKFDGTVNRNYGAKREGYGNHCYRSVKHCI